MLPILSAEQVRAADAHTIANEPVASIDLMERAAARCTEHLLRHVARWRRDPRVPTPFIVVAGMGNNGGDGLVIARLLHQRGQPVRVVRVNHRDRSSEDHATNLERCMRAGVPVLDVGAGELFPVIDEREVVVDALFGTGAAVPLNGVAAEAVRWINAAGRPVVAVDLPSGLAADGEAATIGAVIVQADVTLTFEVPKPTLLLADNTPFVGHWEVVPIGLDRAFIASQQATGHVLERADAQALLPARPWTGHKGTFGHALLIAGGEGHLGAAVLAARGALCSGCGLVTVQVPGHGLPVLQGAVPEAMAIADRDNARISELPRLDAYRAVGIGPGLGTHADTAVVIKRIIQEATMPLVLDADALNILAANPTWRAFLPPGTVLTPHPKEFDRLHGTATTSAKERLERAVGMARKDSCVIVLKGAPTAICTPDGRVLFNSTGNPGMAKGGSGDVLTGLLTGLLAQGLSPVDASVLGVYLHGLAGDIAAAEVGMDGMTSGDLAAFLPAAWRNLRA